MAFVFLSKISLMLYLILSVICSVSVGVIFKIARNKETNAKQIVLFNYVFALVLCLLVFSPDVTALNNEIPIFLYLGLGILLPVVFMFLIASIKNIGIVKNRCGSKIVFVCVYFGSLVAFRGTVCVGKTYRNRNWFCGFILCFE